MPTASVPLSSVRPCVQSGRVLVIHPAFELVHATPLRTDARPADLLDAALPQLIRLDEGEEGDRLLFDAGRSPAVWSGFFLGRIVRITGRAVLIAQDREGRLRPPHRTPSELRALVSFAKPLGACRYGRLPSD